MLNVLSLGAGVQSSTLALMAAAGEIEPMPDCAIFADTGDEPRRDRYLSEWYISGRTPDVRAHVARMIQDDRVTPMYEHMELKIVWAALSEGGGQMVVYLTKNNYAGD